MYMGDCYACMAHMVFTAICCLVLCFEAVLCCAVLCAHEVPWGLLISSRGTCLLLRQGY
jgi:hypothetical protein